MVVAAGFATPRPARHHTQQFHVTTAGEFWQLVARTADSLHLAYLAQSPEARAAMDEAWRMETSRERARDGSVVVDVAWSIHVCPRD